MNSNRGKRPINMLKVPPMTEKEKENFIKAWKQCIPRMGTKIVNLPLIYGTGGQIKE